MSDIVEDLLDPRYMGQEAMRKEAAAEITRLREKIKNQRRELRRLNQQNAYRWAMYRLGLDAESVMKLRSVMHKAFGYEAVRDAEIKAATDAAGILKGNK